MPYIGRTPTNSGQFALMDEISQSFDGSQTQFTCSVGQTEQQPDAANVLITLGGVLQHANEAYTMSGSRIVFSEAPDANTKFYGIITGESQFIRTNSIENIHIADSAQISSSKLSYFTDINSPYASTASFGRLTLNDSGSSLDFVGDVSGSLISTGSFGSVNATHLNGILEGTLGPVANALISGSTVVNAPNISGSITSTGSFGSLVVVDKVQGNLTLGGTLTTGGKLTAGSNEIEGSNFDIDGGTIDGITSLTAGGNLDIGAHGFRANTLTADNQTSGRVAIYGTNGLLSEDSDLTFSGATLTATNLSATTITATGDISTSGSIFAREFHTEFTSASVVFASGSNKFGDTLDDNHRFTGSIEATGSSLSITPEGGVSGSLTSTGSFGSVVAGGTGINSFTGDVGIGITPDNPLHVKVASNENLRVRSDSGVQLTARNDANSSDVAMKLRASAFSFQQGDIDIAGDLTGSITSTGSFGSIVTGGTGVSSFTGNVGIGTDSPTGILTIADSATPALTFKDTGGGADSKIFRLSGGGDKFFFEGRNDADSDDGDAGTMMTFDLTNGRVGIGTATPLADLHVSGASGKIIMSDHGQVTLEMQTNDTAAIFQRVLGSTNTSDINGGIFMFGNDAANEVNFHVNYGGGSSGNNYNRRLRLTSTSASFDNCYVGIGTTAPEGPLHVHSPDGANYAGYTATIKNLDETNNQGNTLYVYGGNGANDATLRVDTISNGTALACLGTGNVGMGTTGPLTAFHVHGAAGNPASSGTTPTAIARFGTSGLNSVLDIGQGADPYPMFLQSADRSNLAQFYELSLNPVGGNVGIGTLNPGTALEVHSDGNSILTLNADRTGTSGQDNAGIYLENQNSSVWAIRYSSGDSNRLEIYDAGFDDGVQLAQNGSGFSDISDERAKTDFVTITDAVDKINSLRAVNFKWKYGNEERRTKNNVGIIAQDVYKVLPEAVYIPENDYKVVDHPIYEGEKQAQNLWTVDKSKLTILLIKAVQELSQKNEALEKRIEELEN